MNRRIERFLFLLKKAAIAIGVLATVISCNYSSDKNGNVTVNTMDSISRKVTTWDSLNLTKFSSIPDTIDGCGDYYLLDNSDLNSDEYIFLSRMREVAIIIQDGDTTYLNNDTLNSKKTNELINDVYIGKNSLKVILSVKKFKEYEEGAFYKGELTIQFKSKKRVFKIHGQTGC